MSRLVKNTGKHGWHPDIAYAAELQGDILSQYHGAGLGYVTVDVKDGFRVLGIEYAPDDETFEHIDGSEAWLDELVIPVLDDGKLRVRCMLSATAAVIRHGTTEAALLNSLN